jgi:hypothetical protein
VGSPTEICGGSASLTVYQVLASNSQGQLLTNTDKIMYGVLGFILLINIGIYFAYGYGLAVTLFSSWADVATDIGYVSTAIFYHEAFFWAAIIFLLAPPALYLLRSRKVLLGWFRFWIKYCNDCHVEFCKDAVDKYLPSSLWKDGMRNDLIRIIGEIVKEFLRLLLKVVAGLVLFSLAMILMVLTFGFFVFFGLIVMSFKLTAVRSIIQWSWKTSNVNVEDSSSAIAREKPEEEQIEEFIENFNYSVVYEAFTESFPQWLLAIINSSLAESTSDPSFILTVTSSGFFLLALCFNIRFWLREEKCNLEKAMKHDLFCLIYTHEEQTAEYLHKKEQQMQSHS